jgi:hypothetical protein
MMAAEPLLDSGVKPETAYAERSASPLSWATRPCITNWMKLALKSAPASAGLGKSSARTGVHIPTIRRFLAKLGWVWVPTMGIGTGCKVHLKDGELPMGRLIVTVSRHIVAVINGVIHDNHDCSRQGTRCVYGYFYKSVA